MTEMLRKISPRHVCGKIKAPDSAIALYTVIGIASGVKQGESDYGPWSMLTGRFEAVNVDTGEIYTSPGCFLPEPMNSLIVDTLLTIDEEGKRQNNSVQFGVEVGLKPADNARGYEYTVRELIDKAEADPLAALRSEVKAALPAPEPKPAAVKKK